MRASGGDCRIVDRRGKEVAKLECGERRLMSVEFGPGEDQIATTWDDGMLRLWRGDGSSTAAVPVDEQNPAGYAAPVVVASPDGTRLLTYSFNMPTVLWDWQGRRLGVLPRTNGEVVRACFSPAGDRILVVHADGETLLCDRDGSALPSPGRHEQGATVGEFAPGGDRLLTAGADGILRMADSAGRPLLALRAHAAAITEASFSPDGTRMLTVCGDGTARTWFVRGEEVLSLAERLGSRDFTSEERSQYADLLEPGPGPEK